MKRVFIILLAICLTSILVIAENNDEHLRLSVEYINTGYFEKAVAELPQIKNWEYDTILIPHLLIDSAETTLAFVASQSLNDANYDSLRLYLATELDSQTELLILRGQYMAALALYYKKLNLELAVLGEHSQRCASTLSVIGMFQHLFGDYIQAKDYYLRALSIRQSILPKNHPEYIESLHRIGLLCLDMGNYDAAKQYLEKAVSISQFANDAQQNYTLSLMSLARINEELGDYKRAEQYMQQVLSIYTENQAEQTLDFASFLDNLANLHRKEGDYKIAEQYYLQSCAITASIVGVDNAFYAKNINNMGILYTATEEWDKAEKYFNQGLNTWKNIIGDNHPEVVKVWHNLGVMFLRKGEYNKADSCFQEALNICKNHFDQNLEGYSAIISSLGSLYYNIRDYTQSEQYFLQALDNIKSTYGESSPRYISTMINLSRTYCATENYAKAAPFIYQASEKYRYQYVKSTEFMSEKQRESYWQTIKFDFEYYFPTFTYRCRYNDLYQSTAKFAYNNELFTKGLLLSSIENVRRSILYNNDTTLIHQWNMLIDEKCILNTLIDKQPNSPIIPQYEQKIEELEKQLTISSSAFRDNEAQWQITWDSVRNHLDKKQVAIEFFTAFLSPDSTMYCALLLRNNSEYPMLIPLFEEKELQKIISNPKYKNINLIYSYDERGHELAKLIWNNIEPEIQQGETIYFAPTGFLHQVAIESLPYDEKRCFADVYHLMRLSSTRELAKQISQIPNTHATLYGGIQYDVDTTLMGANSARYEHLKYVSTRDLESDTLNRGRANYLPATKTETELITTILSNSNIDVKLLTSDTANEESFKAMSSTHQNILHIATHGFYWPDSIAQKQKLFTQRSSIFEESQPHPISIDPLKRCGLLLAGANLALRGHKTDIPKGVQDGILTAKEISLLDLRDANLVVMSACQTGLGEITSDGVFGLQRAFKMAGAQTIIMSLWVVDDNATNMLMTEFYRNWITKKQSKYEAFQNARNTVRILFEEPVYWAGFILLD